MGAEPPGPPSADTEAPPHSRPPATRAASAALLRVYSPASGDHLYITSIAERDNAVAKHGYVDEGSACHVYPT